MAHARPIPSPVEGEDFERVVFLDIDGVLNDDCHEVGKPAIDRGMADLLAYVVCQTNAHIILSSSWKGAWQRFEDNGYEPESPRDEDLVLLKKALDRNDLVIDGATPTWGSGPGARPHEIRAWLLTHPNTCSFVILDDDDFWEFGWMNRHFVCTQTETPEIAWPGRARTARGLTMGHAKRAVEILLDDCPLSLSQQRREHDDAYLARIRRQRKARGWNPKTGKYETGTPGKPDSNG